MTADTQNYSGIENLEVMAEARNYNAYLRALILDNTSEGESVLDFGAGAGTFAEPMQAAGRRLVCIEPDSELQAHLRSKGLEVFTDTASLGGARFDCIYSLNVLEHIEDDGEALAGLMDRLKPGGKLLVYVPAFELLFSSMDRKVGHFRRYRRRPLMRLISATGFEVEHATYVDSLGFFASLLYRIGDQGGGEINRRLLAAYDRFVFPMSRLLDRVTGRFFGKNVAALARRPIGRQNS